MNLSKRFTHAMGSLPLVKQAEKLLAHAKIALTVFIMTFAALFICILIGSAYLLMHLLQGR